MILYNLSCINEDGLRVLVGPMQGRFMMKTREDAESYLTSFLGNGEERLASIFGKQAIGTFRVDAFDCYDHGDPKGRGPVLSEREEWCEKVRAVGLDPEKKVIDMTVMEVVLLKRLMRMEKKP